MVNRTKFININSFNIVHLVALRFNIFTLNCLVKSSDKNVMAEKPKQSTITNKTTVSSDKFKSTKKVEFVKKDVAKVDEVKKQEKTDIKFESKLKNKVDNKTDNTTVSNSENKTNKKESNKTTKKLQKIKEENTNKTNKPKPTNTPKSMVSFKDDSSPTTLGGIDLNMSLDSNNDDSEFENF